MKRVTLLLAMLATSVAAQPAVQLPPSDDEINAMRQACVAHMGHPRNTKDERGLPIATPYAAGWEKCDVIETQWQQTQAAKDAAAAQDKADQQKLKALIERMPK